MRNFYWPLALAVGALLAMPVTRAAQISPNPNPSWNTIVVEGGTSDSNALAFTNNGTITIQQGNTVMAGGELDNLAGVTLTNNGTIQSLVHPINSGLFINHGTVDNYGVVQGPAYNEFGATFNNHAGGTGGVNNAGTLNNAGSFSVGNGSTGVVYNTGLLRNVTNDAGGIVYNSGEIRVGDPLLSWPYSMGSLQTLGSVVNTGTINVNDDGDVTVQGQYWSGSFGSIQSDGEINLTGPTATFSVQAGATVTGTGVYVQDGGTTHVESVTYDPGSGPVEYVGLLEQDEIIINEGFLTGTGTVSSTSAPLYLGPNATVLPGNSPGTLTVDGDMDLWGTYVAEVDGTSLYDVLNITGSVNIESTSTLSLIFSYNPLVDDFFDVLVADQINGEFAFVTASFPDLGGGGGCGEGEGCEGGELFALASYTSAGYSYDLDLIVDAIGSLDVLRVTVTATPAVVPVPAAVWLLGSALGVLGFMRRS